MTVDPILAAIILGLVEGATEFIPVSSTGHLILVGDWLGYRGQRAATFEIFIQLGAILAVAWLYRSRLLQVVRGYREARERRLVLNLALGFVPVAVVGYFTHEIVKARLFNPLIVSIALVAGGVLILLIERLPRPLVVPDVDSLDGARATGIGITQILSLVPGVSRSGATIMGGLALGLSRVAATEFSFFLAMPVMLAATVFDLVDSLHLLTPADLLPFSVGFVTAFLSALVVVRVFLRYVTHNSFAVFAWYRIALGMVLLWIYLGNPSA